MLLGLQGTTKEYIYSLPVTITVVLGLSYVLAMTTRMIETDDNLMELLDASVAGDTLVLATVSDEPIDISATTDLPPGDYCNILAAAGSSDCDAVTVGEDGMFEVSVDGVSAIAIYTD